MHKATVFFVVCVGLLGCSLLLPRSSAAAWPDDPLLNVALCDAATVQGTPVSVSDGAGGAIVAWTDYRNSVYGDIYARRISSDGTVMWTANGLLLCNATGVQRYSTIVSDGLGGAIVTWEDQRNTGDIYAQRISPDGVIRWAANGVAICAAASMQILPMITSDDEGGAIIAWADYRNGGVLDIYAQRVDSSGATRWTTDGVAICTAADGQDYPAIVSDEEGGAIVAWRDHRISDYNLYAQRISAGGVVQWTDNGVAICTATGLQTSLKMAPNGASGAILAWQDVRSAGESDIYAQQVSDDGTVLWAANGVAVCTASGEQWAPSLVLDGVRGAVITWEDRRTSYDFPDIYAQRVDSVGASKWTPDGVAVCTASGGQGLPTIIRDDAGGTIVVWTDYRGTSQDIYAQRLEADGNIQWDLNGVAICALSGRQFNPAVVADGGSGAIIAWQDQRSGSNDDIYAQRVWADGSTPVLLSLVSADIGTDGVKLTWLAGGSGSGVATVYRSPVGGEWTRIGKVTADGTGYLRYTDPIDPTAFRIGYRLGIVDAGVEGFCGETWVDLPAREGNASFALEPVRPNPVQGGTLTVRFTLAGGMAASLDLLDVAGRRVATREVGSLGAGPHSTNLGTGQHLAPGLYLVRLTQGTNTRVTRAAVFE